MSDPVTWLDVLVLLGAYLLASLAWKAVERFQRARATFAEVTSETGGEAAPDPQDGESVDPSRAVCNDPAASPPAFVIKMPGELELTTEQLEEIARVLSDELRRLDREHVVRGDR